MKTNAALIKKEILINKKKLLIAVWIMLAVYALLIIATVAAMILTSNMDVTRQEARTIIKESLESSDMEQNLITSGTISFLFNYMTTLLAAFLCIIGVSSTTAKELVVNSRDNYEMFYRTLPISPYRAVLMKFAAIVGANWVIFVVISLVNFIVFNLYIAFDFRGVIRMNFFTGFLGAIHVIIPALIIGAIIIAFYLMLNSIFQEHSLKYGLGIIGSAHVITLVFNRLYSLNLPSPFRYFTSVLGIGKIDAIPSSDSLLSNQVQTMGWVNLFSWSTLLHIVFGAFMLIIAIEIYKRRELRGI